MGSCLTGAQQYTPVMGKGQNEGGFSQEQLDMYKDCFKLMDINKDGTIDKNDLRGAFDNVGVLMTEGELDGLLGEIGGPCTYDNMVKMFQEKMAGEGNDPDDVIVQAFKSYDNEGKIDVKIFQHALKTWGDKMSQAEIDDVFGEFDIDEEKRTRVPRRRRRRRRRLPSKLVSSCLDNTFRRLLLLLRQLREPTVSCHSFALPAAVQLYGVAAVLH